MGDCLEKKPKGKFAPKLKKKPPRKKPETKQVQQLEGEEVIEKPDPTATPYRTEENDDADFK